MQAILRNDKHLEKGFSIRSSELQGEHEKLKEMEQTQLDLELKVSALLTG